MKISIQFVDPVSKEKMLHNLRNVKKTVPDLRQYIFEVTDKEYLAKSDDGKNIASLSYFADEETHVIHFEKFKGKMKEKIEKMLLFDFPEQLGEKCFVYDHEKKWKMYFSMTEWFLIEKNKVFKIGLDREKLMEVELYNVPIEARQTVGNSA